MTDNPPPSGTTPAATNPASPIARSAAPPTVSSTPGAEQVVRREDRVTRALGQAGALWVGLIIVSLLVNRLRPEAVADRGFLSTPFLWAAALWTLVLVFHALAFERSVFRNLDRMPLGIAGAIGAITFTLGLRSLRSTGTFGENLLYAATNALGTIVFWWAVTSLGFLLMSFVASASPAED